MRTEVSLDGIWSYWIDRDNQYSSINGTEFQEKLPEVMAVEWHKCIIPSVWNLYEKSLMRFYGSAFFRTTFLTPVCSENGQFRLKFGGINYQSLIWLNGQYVGEHNSGYTTFSVDITSVIKSEGESNELVVYVNNAWGYKDRLPWVHTVDWFNYGGIHRSVILQWFPSSYISDCSLNNQIEFSDSESIIPELVNLDVKFSIQNNQESIFHGILMVDLVDYNRQSVIHTQQIEISVEAQQSLNDSLLIHLDTSISLWSPEFPTLYRIAIILQNKEGKSLDQLEWKWGFKKLEIRGPQFYLNNKQMILKGTNRHEDHPSFGLALPYSLQYFELKKMKEANINCFRGAHHANDEYILDICDELGLFFIEEVPAYSLIPNELQNPALLNTAQSIFQEMYERDKNHTCIFAWSLANEIHSHTPQGRQFLEKLFSFARNIDSTRFIIYVSNKHMEDICYDLSDFICINIYEGWYSNRMEDFVSIINTMHEILLDEDQPYGPEKPMVLSEFGAEGLAGYRSWDGAKWSEDYQADFLRFYISKCIEMGFIAGTWTWVFIDFRVDLPQRPDGRPRSYNNKGILTEFRLPKLAFDVVKELYGKWK